MTIGRTVPIEPTRPVSENKRNDPANKTAKTGVTVVISTEARRKADWLNAIELVSAAPDIRADRVAELKGKINDPAYINDILLNDTADRIIDVLWPNGGDTLNF
ncbi:MAG: flagellar biosynthesis anti-sigma factor FlgM [Spirochaetaceae bacterium]|jgi:negative regulator of flagellin synthesis FlgM|nr:flagellar biosynthesis anti-sigma factor FlgM [Spirochaetaceae bacterium]